MPKAKAQVASIVSTVVQQAPAVPDLPAVPRVGKYIPKAEPGNSAVEQLWRATKSFGGNV